MYRFNPAMDFSPLLGAEVVQICIDRLSVIYRLHPKGMVASRGGAWRLFDESGEVVDAGCPFDNRDSFRVHRLLGQSIVRCEVPAPERFRLAFSSGFVLELVDDSDAFETHELVIGDEIVAV